jgi:excisionase family DNA binding protein
MENDVDPPRILTLAQVAELVQLSKRSLHRLIERKEFPAFKVGGQWRVSQSQLNKWLQDLEES